MTEIAYTIEASDPFLIIRLSEYDKSKQQITRLKDGISINRWKTLALSALDKEIMTLMIKEETDDQIKRNPRILSNTTHLYKDITISPQRCRELLELMGATQKLFFKGKQLIVDLFTTVDFYFLCEKQNDSLLVEGRLRWGNKDIGLKDCLCVGVGKPHWFIDGLLLRLISTAINGKRLIELYSRPTHLLEGPEKIRFLQEGDQADADEPQIQFKNGDNYAGERIVSPFPVLVLKDRAGAFADLWMNYAGEKVILQDPRSTLEKTRIKRALATEQNWEKDLLETDFRYKYASHSHYYCPTDKVAKSLAFLLEIGWEVIDCKGNKIVKQSSQSLNLDEKGSKIVVRGTVHFDAFAADVSSVVGAFNRRERFVQLDSSTVGLMSIENELLELSEEGEIVGEVIQINKNKMGALPELFSHAKLSDSLANFKEKMTCFTGIDTVTPSPQFKGRLRPYQQEGLNWLHFLYAYQLGGILADDMGLGKTVQVISLFSLMKMEKPHLIVMPTSLLFNWRKEFETFLPSHSCYVHQGPNRLSLVEELKRQAIILTSYTTLRIDSHLFKQMPFESIILDEAQMIKNSKTQVAQAVFCLDAPFKLSITGTPIENHLNELWSQFHFLMPNLLDSLENFESNVLASASDKRYLEQIKRKIQPFFLRRTKQKVLQDLPERIDQVVWVEMDDDQRSVYEKFLAGVKQNLLKKVDADGVAKHRLAIFEAILRLRQICCHPALVPAIDDSDPADSSKFKLLLDDLKTIVDEGKKVLVYSQFTAMLTLMKNAAKAEGWNFASLDGSTKDREKVVDAFQTDPDQHLFFISLKAGGVGLNITAADYVYLYDPWWNDAAEEQAINRAHRIGRKDVVIAKKFVTVESIEEKMMRLKDHKRTTIEEIFNEESASSSITIDDLKFLLS